MSSGRDELVKFYNPTIESARTINAEEKLKALNKESPVGKWIKGRYNNRPVNGFVIKIIGYGIVNVHWIRNSQVFHGTTSTIGLHGNSFDFYEEDTELKNSDIEALMDLALDMKDYEWARDMYKKMRKKKRFMRKDERI